MQRNHLPARLGPLESALKSQVSAAPDLTLAQLCLWALADQLEAPQAANYRTAAARCVRVFAATVRSDPASHTRLLQAAARLQLAPQVPASTAISS